MYLKRLYHNSKFLLSLMILFAVFQVINNIRQDVSFSPVYTYGMYSEKLQAKENYIVPEIIVNGKLLQTKKFAPQQWDKIILPVLLFEKQAEWNADIYHNYVHRLLRISDSSYYINDLSQLQFNEWYKKYLAFILDENITSLSITFSKYDLQQSLPLKLQTLKTIVVE